MSDPGRAGVSPAVSGASPGQVGAGGTPALPGSVCPTSRSIILQTAVEGGYPGYAASRAYYAMFYVAEAFLEGEGMAFSKHSAVVAAFGRYFAHARKVPIEFHRYLMEAQEVRHAGDYGLRHAVTVEQAREQISRAEQFLELAERVIGRIQPADGTTA